MFRNRLQGYCILTAILLMGFYAGFHQFTLATISALAILNIIVKMFKRIF